jgi:branched-chain amino acid transport system ATP-binding protein
MGDKAMLLEFDRCEVVYSKRQVLDGVYFKVDTGEILAIVGHNGAGKTTILKAIMGMVKVRRGAVRLQGSEITNCSTQLIAQKGIRLLPADIKGIFPTLTVLDNLKLGFPPNNHKNSKSISGKIDFCLEIFPDLGEKLKQLAGILSGGQQQMLALSVALMGDPKLLLLDEPSIGLAPQLVQKMLGQVSKLASTTELGIILVEQNIKAAFEVADRVLAIKSGRLIYEGHTSELSPDRLWSLF